MIEVELPDGTVVEFPDGMSQDDMRQALQKRFGAPTASSADGEPGKFGGAAMNATAGANETLYALAGAPVDLVRGAMNLGVRGVNAVTGTEVPTIPENSFGGSRWIGETMGAIRPELDPSNTQATTAAERVARGTGQGVAGTILPAAVVGGLARTGTLGAQGAETAARIAGRSNSVRSAGADAVAGAAGGAGATAAMELTPDEYDPLSGLAGGIVGGGLGALATGIPGLARETARAGRDFLAPLSQGGRERMAGQQINDAATDPAALREALTNELSPTVPGSKPTTGQATGDMGVLTLERAAQSRDPAAFQQRRADQNTARREALDTLQPTGAAENVTRALRQRLADIDREASEGVDMTRQTAQGRAEMIGQPMRAEDAGDVLRENLQRRRGLAVEKERRLWNAVDPDGTLALPATNTTRVARGTATNIPASAKPPSGEEAAIYDVLGRYGDVVPFQEMTALRSRVSTAMADERGRHGKSPTWARMSTLRDAIEKDIDQAVTMKVQRETEAVTAGTMREQDTLEAAVSRQVEAWFAERAVAGTAGGRDPTGFAASGAVRPSAPPRVLGTAGQGQRPTGAPPRDPRLSPDGLDPNFDRAAQERLNRATDATRQRADTFDSRQTGPMLARPADHASYNMESARVAARAFTPGSSGFERMQAVRRALGPNSQKAMAAIESYAIDSLRKTAMGDDGLLDPAKVDRWRRAHADALRAFPELDIRIGNAADASETAMQLAAARKTAIDDAQKGAIGRLIGVEDPQDVSRIVGGLFGRQDSVQQLVQLRRSIGDDKEALQGLRKAAADFISARLVTNTEGATSGQTLISADQMQTFVRQNKTALRTMFSAEEVGTLEAIAADLQRANRSLNAVRIPGQSNTVQDALAVTSGDTATSILGKLLTASMASGGALAGIGVGGGTGAVLGAGGGALVGALRQSGIQKVDELVTDALLNPNRARLLLAKVPANAPAREEAMWRSLARRYAKASIASAAVASGSNDRGPPAPEGIPQITVTPLPPSQRDPLADAMMSR